MTMLSNEEAIMSYTVLEKPFLRSPGFQLKEKSDPKSTLYILGSVQISFAILLPSTVANIIIIIICILLFILP